jgi:alkanesulfonate monooxygenase SsuD/methylene tetrahydromethanopterin reductase-like flavin-dependent oxidoreductase (luciferase family)
MRVGISLPIDDRFSLADLLRIARAAQQSGFEDVATGEIASVEAFSLLGALAAIGGFRRMGTGVVPIYSRPPALAAMAFANLSTIVEGQVFAGFGVSSETIVEEWFGIERGHPLNDMRAFVGVFKQALSGVRTSSSEGRFRSTGFRLLGPTAEVPVVIGAMKPRILELAGEIADGVMLSLVPVMGVSDRLVPVNAGRVRSGRINAQFEVSVSGVRVYFGPSLDLAREWARKRLQPYAQLSTHNQSFGGAAARVGTVQISDPTLDSLGVFGSLSALDDRLAAYREAGVDTLYLHVSGAGSGDVEGCVATVTAMGKHLFG